MADAQWRRSPNPFQFPQRGRKCHQPARWRGDHRSADQLGLRRVLGGVLSVSSADHDWWPFAGARQYAPAAIFTPLHGERDTELQGRGGSRAAEGLEPSYRYVLRTDVRNFLDHGNINYAFGGMAVPDQYFRSADHSICTGPRLGIDPEISAALEPGSRPPGLLQPDRAGSAGLSPAD